MGVHALVREKMREVRAKAAALSAADRTAQDIDEDLDRMAQACSDAQQHWKGGDADEAIAALDDVAAWAKSVKQDITQFKTNSPDVDDVDTDPDGTASAKPARKALTQKVGTGSPVADSFQEQAREGLQTIRLALNDAVGAGFQDAVEDVDGLVEELDTAIDEAAASIGETELADVEE